MKFFYNLGKKYKIDLLGHYANHFNLLIILLSGLYSLCLFKLSLYVSVLIIAIMLCWGNLDRLRIYSYILALDKSLELIFTLIIYIMPRYLKLIIAKQIINDIRSGKIKAPLKVNVFFSDILERNFNFEEWINRKDRLFGLGLEDFIEFAWLPLIKTKELIKTPTQFLLHKSPDPKNLAFTLLAFPIVITVLPLRIALVLIFIPKWVLKFKDFSIHPARVRSINSELDLLTLKKNYYNTEDYYHAIDYEGISERDWSRRSHLTKEKIGSSTVYCSWGVVRAILILYVYYPARLTSFRLFFFALLWYYEPEAWNNVVKDNSLLKSNLLLFRLPITCVLIIARESNKLGNYIKYYVEDLLTFVEYPKICPEYSTNPSFFKLSRIFRDFMFENFLHSKNNQTWENLEKPEIFYSQRKKYNFKIRGKIISKFEYTKPWDVGPWPADHKWKKDNKIDL